MAVSFTQCWRPSFLSTFLILLLSASTCQKNDEAAPHIKPGGTYRIPISSEITSLDPISGQYFSWSIGSQIYEGLMTYSRDESQIVPLLAESYEVNGLSYTFQLRKGVKFHDNPCFPEGKGREVTANDILYSFERGRPLDKRTLYVQIIDRYSFTIEVKTPDPNLLKRLTAPGFFVVPKESVEFYGPDFKLHPVGTGPFRFAQLIPNEKLVLVRNENYRARENDIPLPYLDGIEYLSYLPGEMERMILDFQTGQIEECTEQALHLVKDLVALDARGKLQLQGWLGSNNVQVAKDRIFRQFRYLEVIEENQHIRQALSLAINRQRLVENQVDVYHETQVAKGPIAPDCDYFSGSLKGQSNDPDRARRLLERAGFPAGKGLPEFQFLSQFDNELELIVEDLEAVGFRIKRRPFFPGWREWFGQQNHLLMKLTNTNVSLDCDEVFNAFPAHPECARDSSFVQAFKAWQRSGDPAEKVALVNDLEQIVADITPMILLYHIDGEVRLLQQYVRGRQLGNASGHKLLFVWLER